MSVTPHELPADVKDVIESTPLPFEQLEPYQGTDGLYELSRRSETGYDVVLLFRIVGSKAMILTRVEKNGESIVDVPTPSNKALDRLEHTFPNVPQEESKIVFPRAAYI